MEAYNFLWFHIRVSIALSTLLFLGMPAHGQTRIADSLRKELVAAKSPDTRMHIAFALCEQRRSLNADSIFRYADIALSIARSGKQEQYIATATYYIACALEQNGSLDSGAAIVEKLLAETKTDKANGNLYRKCIALHSNFLIRSNNYKEAIASAYTLLADGEAHKDTLAQVSAYCAIGWSYMEMNQSAQALSWFRKALLFEPYNDSHYFSVIYSNMAAVYGSLRQYDSAEHNIDIAIRVAGKYETLSFLANALNIKADILILTGRSYKAEPLLKEALAIRQKIGDPYYIVSDMCQLALYYAHNGQAGKGIQLCKEGITIARRENILAKMPLLYLSLAECYKAAGDFNEYGNTLERLIALKDSVYQSNSAEALARLNTKFQLQKKENTIIRQKLALVKQDYLLYGGFVFALIILFFAVISFRNYRKRENMKLLWLLEQEKAQAAHNVKDAEEKERKRIAADLHDNLGAYAASIASNIDNITHKLEGSMSDNDTLQLLRTNSLSMVSELSDTIWALKKDTLSLTAISDRLKTFSQRLQPNYPYIGIEVQEHISFDYLLQPSHAFHLFHTIQEAVNNALRHSRATQVTITISGSATQWSVAIADDGVGILSQKIVSGNGITNMRHRVESNGWHISWEALSPRGTAVKIFGATTTN